MSAIRSQSGRRDTPPIIYKALRCSGRPALLGVLFEAIGAGWVSRYFASLPFGIQPFDARTWIIAVALLLLTVALACCLPGRRAMRTNPAVALRVE